MSSEQKKIDVPLEEALNITGTGRYTNYVILTSSLIVFGSLLSIQQMSIVLPVVGCDLQLTSSEKGSLTSITFAGMLISGPLSGLLSDVFGRVRISFLGLSGSLILLFLNSFAPNTTALMIINFLNGFLLTGAITPNYVMVSEFCPQDFRTTALIICSIAGSLANMYLPGMALLIMPMDIKIPILGFLTFSSWRLYFLFTTIPNLLALILLWKLPETPKFLLLQGQSEKTLEVLQCIYAVNHKKKKDEFPVLNVILDSIDRDYGGLKDEGNTVSGVMQQMISRTKMLFNRTYFSYTLMSSAMLFTEVGVYNVFILWLPEHLSRMNQYLETNGVYDLTLCDLMMSTGSSVKNVEECALKFDFFSYAIILGILQFLIGILVGGHANKFGKKLLLVGFLFLVSGMNFSLLFFNAQYLIIAVLIAVPLFVSITFVLAYILIVEFYPTYVRSTASAVTSIFARLGAAGGSQILGLLYDNHCGKAYYGMTAILAATAVMCLFIPSKKNH